MKRYYRDSDGTFKESASEEFLKHSTGKWDRSKTKYVKIVKSPSGKPAYLYPDDLEPGKKYGPKQGNKIAVVGAGGKEYGRFDSAKEALDFVKGNKSSENKVKEESNNAGSGVSSGIKEAADEAKNKVLEAKTNTTPAYTPKKVSKKTTKKSNKSSSNKTSQSESLTKADEVEAKQREENRKKMLSKYKDTGTTGLDEFLKKVK